MDIRNFPVTTATEYYDKENLTIDWFDDGGGKVPSAEADIIQYILVYEISEYLMRQTTGLCGSLIDRVRELKADRIRAYKLRTGLNYIRYSPDF